MNNKQPKIKIAWTALDISLEILAILALAALWLILLYFYAKLPNTIPVHFDAAGKIDGYGPKILLLFEPLFASILYTGLTVLNRYPHLFNYLSPINEDNAAYQYRMATRLIRYLKLLIVFLFIFVLWTSIQAVSSQNEGLGLSFLPIFFALVFIPILFVLVKTSKNKKAK